MAKMPTSHLGCSGSQLPANIHPERQEAMAPGTGGTELHSWLPASALSALWAFGEQTS